MKDVKNIKQYLIDAMGFGESEMLILMDDGRHHSPTKKNIEDAFRRMTEYSVAGDVVFVHYSGHVRFFVSCFLFLFLFVDVFVDMVSTEGSAAHQKITARLTHESLYTPSRRVIHWTTGWTSERSLWVSVHNTTIYFVCH